MSDDSGTSRSTCSSSAPAPAGSRPRSPARTRACRPWCWRRPSSSAGPPPTRPAPAGSRTTASSGPTASPTTPRSPPLSGRAGRRQAPRASCGRPISRTAPRRSTTSTGSACGSGIRKTVVDYHPEVAGAGLGGRALEPQTFDGRRLGQGELRPRPAAGPGVRAVRRHDDGPPGRGEPAADDLRGIACKASLLALRLGVRWANDRLRYPRGTRLAMGNALVANLFHKLLQRDGQVWFSATATRLLTDGTAA